MLQHSIPHRHEDGTVHYTHCDGEYDAAYDPSVRVPIMGHGRNGLRPLRLFGMSLGIATTAFWGVMLLSPPLTQAYNEPARLAPCLAAAAEVAPWFEREIRRRANFGVTAFEHGSFKSMLLDYDTARWHCAAGRVDAAVRMYGALAARVTTNSDHDEPEEH